MQHTPTLAAEQQPTVNARPSSTGPRPLDPSEFKFVSGGAPKNGWPDVASSAGSADALAAPKNGW